MATIVAFHAHPDDESIGSGGTLARAAAEGHRVVLVLATRGERGEEPPGLLGPDETLAQRRVAETEEAAAILGVHRTVHLGYRDSGMAGDAGNDDPECFHRCPVETAAGALAAVLVEECPEALMIYDEFGVTGHPDHVQVHHVGVRAAELAGVARVYEGTIRRSRIRALAEAAAAAGVGSTGPGAAVEMGTPDERITTDVDVRSYLELKRRAMAAHRSQLAETSPLLAMPAELFEQVWGVESAILRGAPPGLREDWILGPETADGGGTADRAVSDRRARSPR